MKAGRFDFLLSRHGFEKFYIFYERRLGMERQRAASMGTCGLRDHDVSNTSSGIFGYSPLLIRTASLASHPYKQYVDSYESSSSSIRGAYLAMEIRGDPLTFLPFPHIGNPLLSLRTAAAASHFHLYPHIIIDCTDIIYFSLTRMHINRDFSKFKWEIFRYHLML